MNELVDRGGGEVEVYFTLLSLFKFVLSYFNKVKNVER